MYTTEVLFVEFNFNSSFGGELIHTIKFYYSIYFFIAGRYEYCIFSPLV